MRCYILDNRCRVANYVGQRFARSLVSYESGLAQNGQDFGVMPLPADSAGENHKFPQLEGRGGHGAPQRREVELVPLADLLD